MKIILKGNDNSVAIMELAPGADKEKAIKQFKECHPGMYGDYFEDIEIPTDRTFRDAWTLSQGKIVIDQKKAREIHLNRIRAERDIKLKELDVETMRHLSNPEKLKEIEEQKQKLRDLPQEIKL